MSNRWPGGLIRKTPVTPAGPFQNGAAPGVWTLAEASFWTKQGLWPIAGNVLAVEDVFSTWLYTGNSATQTITNGIDLAGKGGLVWTKARSSGFSNGLVDTVRGALNTLISNSTDGSTPSFNTVTAFTSSGFSIGTSGITNSVGTTYVSWTFREAPNFFDVVTYTGNAVAGRAIAHSLGSAPGCIIVKELGNASQWFVYHRSLGATNVIELNNTGASYASSVWNNASPTATEFYLGSGSFTNRNGGTYVAYLFAHDPSADGFIQCGSFNNSGGPATVTLGWEPQWILMKNAAADGDWFMVDNMRGLVVGGSDPYLYANSAVAENSGDIVTPTATGFVTVGLPGSTNFIYMAIRRGPMRTPTLGTSVFSPVYATSASSPYTVTTNFPVDLVISTDMSGSNKSAMDRLRGGTTTNYVIVDTNRTASEATGSSVGIGFQNNTAVVDNSFWAGYGLNVIYWNFRRAPGFFDEVCYTGTGVVRTVTHNLGVVPELTIIKRRDSSGDWRVTTDFTGFQYLNDPAPFAPNAEFWGYGTPTSTTIPLGTNASINASGGTFVAYLFASVPGVSKVGSYTGNGSSQTINCAFTTGARFVLIKRTDSTGDWYVWDSARGIVAGNDPYLALNTTAAEVTSNDSVDTDNTGFIVNQVAASNINVNAATYIFLAIA